MHNFYYYNMLALFLEDGNDTRKMARKIYNDFGIKSVLFTKEADFFTKISPYIKVYELQKITQIDFFLEALDSFYEKNKSRTIILFVKSPNAKKLVDDYAEFFESRFITNPRVILENL